MVFRSGLDFWKPSIDWNKEKFRSNSTCQVFLKIWSIQKFILYAIVIAFIFISLFVFFRTIIKRHISMSFILVCYVMVPALLQALVTYGTNSRYSYPFDFIMVFVILLFLKEYNIWNKIKLLLNK